LALIAKQASALRLTALDPASEALGLTPGLSLSDARAQVPELKVADADPAADRAAHKAIAELCRRYTPSLAINPPDGVDLNITGCERLSGSETALAAALAARLKRLGYSARAGIADTPSLAWAMARFSPDPVAPAGRGPEALARLPMAALRLEDDTLELLRGLGLRRVGQVLDPRARAGLARRLGETVVERLDQALGARSTPMRLKLEIPPWSTELALADPVSSEADVLGLTERIARRLCERLEAQRLGGRLFVLELHRVDGACRRLAVAASRPLRDPPRIAALFAERVGALNEGLEADYGFDLLRLWARRVQPFDAGTGRLIEDGPDQAGFAVLVDRLSASAATASGLRCSSEPWSAAAAAIADTALRSPSLISVISQPAR
jgi:protein ImuB